MKQVMAEEALFDHHISPQMEEVKVYFSKKGMPENEAEDFFFVYEHRHWKCRKRNFIKNWKAFAYRWVVSVWKANPPLFEKMAH
ncbi:MAG: hypothetical protein P4L51_14540 [Puia sp.]|nr:hypothetical protein [Puia sp.]